MASKPTCDAGCHVTLGRPPIRLHFATLSPPTGAASTYQLTYKCPSGVLRHLVTSKHVRDTSVRRRVAGRHYPIHRGRCGTLQHRRFHTGSVGVRGSNPRSSTYLTPKGSYSNPDG